METFFRVIDKTLGMALFVALAAMVAVVGTNVFCRYILGNALPWGEEVAKGLLVWLTFLGAAVAMRDMEHPAFDYLVHALPKRAVPIFSAFSQVIVVLMTLLLIYWSTEVTIKIRLWVMPATGISRSLVYAACPVGSFFLFLYALRSLLIGIRKPLEPSTEHPSATL